VARLPNPGGDNNAWGDVLNDFLTQSHNTDGTLKRAAIEATGAISDAVASHAAQASLHGTGAELAIAQKTDVVFATTSTTPVAVPGLSITVIVPDRPYVVRLTATGIMALANNFSRLDIMLSGGTAIAVPPAFGYTSAINGQATFVTELRVPNAFHNPAVSATVTYQVYARTESASSAFTLLAGNFSGADYSATLVAMMQ